MSTNKGKVEMIVQGMTTAQLREGVELLVKENLTRHEATVRSWLLLEYERRYGSEALDKMMEDVGL